MKQILDFLSGLACHNDRLWFADHKAQYQTCMQQFTAFTEEYIRRMVAVDPALAPLTPKDCIWRIYRDIRFSADKRPYKEWFGTFLGQPHPDNPALRGRKSMYGGYYVHVQPGHCMFAGGIWCPSPDLLRTLRREIIANYDEVESIMSDPSWQRYFGDFDTEWMLRRVPAEFAPTLNELQASGLIDPTSFARLQGWVQRKAYTFCAPLTDEQVVAPDLIDRLVDIAQAAKPMNDFLNYSFSCLSPSN